MKPHFLCWLGITAAAAAAVLCWYFLTGEPDATPRTAGKSPALAAQVTGKRAPSLPAEPPPQPAPEVKLPAAGPGPGLLDSEGRDAAELITAWDMSRGNVKLLMAAAERFPGDPRVCSAMIGHAGSNTQKALPWIERLIAAEPQNPHGFYLKAWALLANDRAGAFAALRQATALPGPRDTHLPDRMLAVRDAAIAGAATRGDAARAAIAFAQRHSTGSSYFLSGPFNAIIQELADAKVSGSENRLMDITGIGLATAEHFSSGGGLFFWNAIQAGKLTFDMLVDLPDDTEIGDHGQTAASMMAEVRASNDALRAALRETATVRTLLNEASDDVAWTYVEYLASRGEPEARTWLMAQAGQVK